MLLDCSRLAGDTLGTCLLFSPDSPASFSWLWLLPPGAQYCNHIFILAGPMHLSSASTQHLHKYIAAPLQILKLCGLAPPAGDREPHFLLGDASHNSSPRCSGWRRGGMGVSDEIGKVAANLRSDSDQSQYIWTL